ncbi:hypothetical protein GCM10010149_87800 [Nonomuraea roseoviolacea subsp. roseoviolacea]
MRIGVRRTPTLELRSAVEPSAVPSEIERLRRRVEELEEELERERDLALNYLGMYRSRRFG